MLLTLFLKIQGYFFSKEWFWLYRQLRRLSKHYRTFQADDVCQSSLGASYNNFFRIGIFFSQNTDLLKVSNDMLMELSNGIIRSQYLAALTLIQGHEQVQDNPLPNASQSSMLSLPGQVNKKERLRWLKQQVLANSIDIWLVIDSSSEFLEEDLMVFLENSNQVIVLSEIPFDQKERKNKVEIHKTVYSLPDWLLISNEEEIEHWRNAGFDNCLIRSVRVLDQVIDCYKNQSLQAIGKRGK